MKHVAVSGAGALLVCLCAHAGTIDPALEKVLAVSAPDEVVSTLVFLTQQSNIRDLTAALDAAREPLHERHRAVVLDLQATAQNSQGPIVADLAALEADGRVRSFQAFWISNLIRVDAPAPVILEIAARADVDVVFLNHPIEGVRPVIEGPDNQGEQGGVAGGIEPGINAIRAPEAWALGIDGEGALVSTLDTGVSGAHPALGSRWRGNDPAYAGHPGWAFFDPVTNWQFPQDSGDHGTHTMGSVCGGGPGDQIGVAPGAEWIHAAVIDRVSIAQTVADAILAFQWVIDPDGNPNTSFDVPDVCSNSWGLADVHGYPDCDPLFWSYLDACEAAGVFMLFAAGNEGFGGLRRPADRATDEYRTFAVAAVNGNVPSFPIAGFSSRGPTFCTPGGGSAIKPEISGPGVDVRSSVPVSGYGVKSGTSMSTPHLCGVVALLRSAVPNLTVQQAKQVMFDTALNLGPPGNDNDYGYGMVDAFEAVQLALNVYTLQFNFPDGLPEYIDPFGGETIHLSISGQNSQPMPETARLHYSIGGPYIEVPLVVLGENQYDAVFPDFDCGTPVEYYFSVMTDTGHLIYNPLAAPQEHYAGLAYTGLEITHTDDFDHDSGWTVENSPDLTTGAWERGVPAGNGSVGDPPDDADGSGTCWVTDNSTAFGDVDGTSTTLTSTDLDASVMPNPMIAYWRWYDNAAGAPSVSYQDVLVVDVSNDGGKTWTNLETVGPGKPEDPNVEGSWIRKEFLIGDFVAPTDEFRIRFIASDLNEASVIEAAIDGLQISAFYCGDLTPPCPADVTGDGEVNVADLSALILDWGCIDPPGPCPGDVNRSGEVDVQDLTDLILAWGACP